VAGPGFEPGTPCFSVRMGTFTPAPGCAGIGMGTRVARHTCTPLFTVVVTGLSSNCRQSDRCVSFIGD
jgi:hypothetical protein